MLLKNFHALISYIDMSNSGDYLLQFLFFPERSTFRMCLFDSLQEN